MILQELIDEEKKEAKIEAKVEAIKTILESKNIFLEESFYTTALTNLNTDIGNSVLIKAANVLTKEEFTKYIEENNLT